MHPRKFDMLHDSADKHVFSITYRINVNLYCVAQKAIQQYRGIVRDIDCLAHVLTELIFIPHDFHGAATQYIGWPNHQRIANEIGCQQCVVYTDRGCIGWLLQVQLMQQRLKILAVFGLMNRLCRGADNRNVFFSEFLCEFQRSLPTVLDDNTIRLFNSTYFQHVFDRQRLEVESI